MGIRAFGKRGDRRKPHNGSDNAGRCKLQAYLLDRRQADLVILRDGWLHSGAPVLDHGVTRLKQLNTFVEQRRFEIRRHPSTNACASKAGAGGEAGAERAGAGSDDIG